MCVSRCVAPLCRVRRGRHEFARRDCVCVCDCVVPPCLLRRRSLTAAPTLCCAVAAVAAGLTVPAPVPLTTSPPATTPVPTAMLYAALRCCAWRQDGPASSRAFATGWLCWSVCARRAGQMRASDCLSLPTVPPLFDDCKRARSRRPGPSSAGRRLLGLLVDASWMRSSGAQDWGLFQARDCLCLSPSLPSLDAHFSRLKRRICELSG